jgi:predicted RNA binding protein YcfA (HicA-like mRNA interferase family)
MTKKEKLLTKFNNLRGEASFSEAKKVMEMMGYRIIRMRGSHFIFEKNNPDEPEKMTIPVHCNKIKKKYVLKIKKLINNYV